MKKFISQAELARKAKLSRARITQLVKLGTLNIVNGKLNAREALEAIRIRADRRRHWPQPNMGREMENFTTA